MSVRVVHADMLEAIPHLVADGIVCDAVVTDPPYHLIATQKRFGAANSAPAQYGKDGAMSRLSGGFMGQQWDGGDIAFRPETWATVATILRPGAFLLAFGGTRTYHRLVCAIEDAGFVIQDTIAWLYGSGFPKRRGMLKPAFEPIVLAYKPGGKRMLQVNECRVGYVSDDDKRLETRGVHHGRPYDGLANGAAFAKTKNPVAAVNHAGRWPANVCHDGSQEVLEAFGETTAVVGYRSENSRDAVVNGTNWGTNNHRSKEYPGDANKSAARFFFSAKANAHDRWGSRHPTVKPVELMKWLVPLVCPPGGLVLDPFAGSGTTGVAALATARDCILIEREQTYYDDTRERMAFYEGGGKHSVQAKNRNRKQDAGPLFNEWQERDAIGSYETAVKAIGERVKAGEPVPDFMLSSKDVAK